MALREQPNIEILPFKPKFALTSCWRCLVCCTLVIGRVVPIFHELSVASNRLLAVNCLEDQEGLVISRMQAVRLSTEHVDERLLLHALLLTTDVGRSSHEVRIVNEFFLPKFLQAVDCRFAHLRA